MDKSNQILNNVIFVTHKELRELKDCQTCFLLIYSNEEDTICLSILKECVKLCQKYPLVMCVCSTINEFKLKNKKRPRKHLHQVTLYNGRTEVKSVDGTDIKKVEEIFEHCDPTAEYNPDWKPGEISDDSSSSEETPDTSKKYLYPSKNRSVASIQSQSLTQNIPGCKSSIPKPNSSGAPSHSLPILLSSDYKDDILHKQNQLPPGAMLQMYLRDNRPKSHTKTSQECSKIAGGSGIVKKNSKKRKRTSGIFESGKSLKSNTGVGHTARSRVVTQTPPNVHKIPKLCKNSAEMINFKISSDSSDSKTSKKQMISKLVSKDEPTHRKAKGKTKHMDGKKRVGLSLSKSSREEEKRKMEAVSSLMSFSECGVEFPRPLPLCNTIIQHLKLRIIHPQLRPAHQINITRSTNVGNRSTTSHSSSTSSAVSINRATNPTITRSNSHESLVSIFTNRGASNKTLFPQNTNNHNRKQHRPASR